MSTGWLPRSHTAPHHQPEPLMPARYSQKSGRKNFNQQLFSPPSLSSLPRRRPTTSLKPSNDQHKTVTGPPGGIEELLMDAPGL